MCTAISLMSSQGESYFGRTMDFSYPLEAGLYMVPKNHKWRSLTTGKRYIDAYAFMAIGQENQGILAFFDGVNERGFAAAALYFKDYAFYDLPRSSKESVASLDFLHYILGNCGSVEDLRNLLKNVQIAGAEDPVTKTVAPLHWFACDRSGKSVVIEQTKRGLEIFNNRIGVLANAPDFRWQMTNLRNYAELSPAQHEEVSWGNLLLSPFGQGAGSRLMPGGYTSPERFARTAFLKTHVPPPNSRVESVMSCFHIMNSVTIPKGIVLTEKGSWDYTLYTAFINTNSCEYYFKTYENDQIIRANLRDYIYAPGTQTVLLGSLVRPLLFE